MTHDRKREKRRKTKQKAKSKDNRRDKRNMTAPQLSDSVELKCGTVLPNRLVKSAMTEALADSLGRPTKELCNLYEAWSKGGCGLLITGNVQVDRRYTERPGNVCIDGLQSEKSLELFKNYARAGKHNGCKIIVQLSHAGRQSNGMVNMKPVGPGNIRINLPKQMFGDPRALSEEEIHSIVERFTYAAKFCKESGFDGIQIHSAHGYLFSSFLNPLANNRVDIFGEDDQYGGPLENRARALLETVRSIRKVTGKEFLISVKLNSADFQQGGFTTKEASQVAVWLEEEGIDLLEISGGNYESGIFKSTTDSSSTTNSTKRASTIIREAYFLQYALDIKDAVTSLPIMVTGGWRSKSAMEAALVKDECVLFGLGRPLCCNANCVNQMLNGYIEELPRYEDTIQVGHYLLQWLLSLPFKIFYLIRIMSLQGWYYCNIVQIAKNGNGDENIGAFSSFLANRKHEEKFCSEMTGVNCTGTHYKGINDTVDNNKTM